jgi:ABC-2 type transport system permease protein
MILGKVLGGSFVALAQGLLFLLLGLTLPISLTFASAVQLFLLLSVACLAITSLGTFFAWKTDSTQGFHAIMNLVLMPLWLLSGGFFPAPALAADARWDQWLLGMAMRLNPLSYAVGGVRRLIAPTFDFSGAWVPGLTMSWLVTLLFAVVAFGLAVNVSRQRTSGDLL